MTYLNDDAALDAVTRARRPRRQPAPTYTVPDILRILRISRRTFFRLRKSGAAPFLEDVTPRVGRTVHYRAAPVDAYLVATMSSRDESLERTP